MADSTSQKPTSTMTRSRYAFVVNKALRGLLAANTLELSAQQLADLKAIEALDADRATSLLGPEALARLRLISDETPPTLPDEDHEPAVVVKKQKTVDARPAAVEEVADDSNSGPLVERVIQGRRVRIGQLDYDRFVRNDKWASCEFFRFVPSNSERPCQFCRAKCKTITDGIYMCAACRHFAHKSLVKHHMFVCKSQQQLAGVDEDAVDRCNDLSKVNQVPQDLHCRYCFFKQIVTKLPSLNRLQRNMIEFINRRLMFVNSVSQKSMLWKNRIASTLKKKAPGLLFQQAANSGSVKVLQSKTTNINKQLASLSKSPPSAATLVSNRIKLRLGHHGSKTSRTVLGSFNKTKRLARDARPPVRRRDSSSSPESETEEAEPSPKQAVVKPAPVQAAVEPVSEATTDDELTAEQLEDKENMAGAVRSPRIKHVSREPPKSIALCYKLAATQRASLINYIKLLNEDMLLETPMISWTTGCVDLHFNLSSLPLSSKLVIQRKHEERLSRLRAAAPPSVHHSPGSSAHNKDSADADYRPNRSASQRLSQHRTSRDEPRGDHEAQLRQSRTHSSDEFRPNANKSMKFIRSCHYLKSFEGAALQQQLQSSQSASGAASSFNWDEYFEKNHKISTSQNIRFSSLLNTNEQNTTAAATTTYDPIGRKSRSNTEQTDTFVPSSSTSIPTEPALTSSTKRLSSNLNSYKDRTRVYSEHPLKKNFLDVANISNSVDTLGSSIDNLNKTYYENLHKNVLIWDIQIDYDKYSLWKHGLAIADKKPLPFKSACFTCASNQSTEANPLLYCSTCCEPSHLDCLEEQETPKRGLINWTCSKCRFCETCKQGNQLLTCSKCDNSFHGTCFKKNNYPTKTSKKCKTWICADCFKCKSCHGADIFYDKKLFLKALNYDFSLCFKCLKQHQLGFFCHSCQGAFDESEASTSNDLLNCQRCKRWHHLKCLEEDGESVSNETQYLFKDAEFKFECAECCGSADKFQAKMAEFKTKTFKAIVDDLKSVMSSKPPALSTELVVKKEEDEMTIELTTESSTPEPMIVVKVEEKPDLLTSYLESYQPPEVVVNLATTLNEFYNHLWSGLPADQSRRAELRDQLKNIIDGRLDRFSEIFEVFQIKEPQVSAETVTVTTQEPESSVQPTEPLTLTTEELTSVQTMSASEQSKSVSESSRSAASMLAEKKKKCAIDELVKVPYDDHTYAISASSISLALQSSNIFNQNNNAQGSSNETYTDLKKKFQHTEAKTHSAARDQSHGEFDEVFKSFQNSTSRVDDRECLLCHSLGDCEISGRLVSVDTSYWLHVNCALWSDETFLESGNLVKHIHLVFNKCKSSICAHCKKDGASISCSSASCGAIYHFKCAQTAKCVLTSSQLTADQVAEIKERGGKVEHDTKLRLLATKNSTSLFCAHHGTSKLTHKDFNLFEQQQFNSFDQALYVELNDDAWRKKNGFPWFTVTENFSDLHLLVGSLHINKIGDLDTISDYDHYLCPIDYEATRLYWSTFKLGHKCLYTLRIRRVSPKVVGVVKEGGQPEPPVVFSSLDETLASVCKNNVDMETTPAESDPTPAPATSVIPSIAQTDGNSDEQDRHHNPTMFAPISSGQGGQEFAAASSIKKPIITLNRQLGSNLIKLSTGGFKNFKIIKPPSSEPSSDNSSLLFRPAVINGGLHRSAVNLLNVPSMAPLNIKILERQQQQEFMSSISPKSDKSDSSLNLDNSSRIINPIYSFDKTITPNRILSAGSVQDAKPASPEKETPKPAAAVQGKTAKPKPAKVVKSPKKFNPNKQITVAALLSASYTSNNSKSIESDSNNSNDIQPVMMIRASAFRENSSSNSNSGYQTPEPPPAPPVKATLPEPETSESMDEIDKSISNLIESLARGEPTATPEPVPSKKKEKPVKTKAPAEPAKKIRHIPSSSGRREPTTHHLVSSDSREKLVFEVTSEDGFFFQSDDINKAWRAVTDRVKKLRAAHKLKELSYKSINGFVMFGLDSKYLRFALERLDSIQFCEDYRKRHSLSLDINENWKITDGSARTILPFKGVKKHSDAFYWLSSEYRDLASISRLNLFDQSFLQARKALISSDMFNSMKYRHLKEFSKNSLIVKKSGIHGRGLFTLVDIYPSQMIIEYAGEIIRHQLCDKREKYYETKNIGCYMFKIDEFEVIDATSRGNQARFINHSCDPNCVSKVLIIQGQKHIIIFAHRLIQKGEELTYDYKFPKEDLKIQCLCKSSKCRKYLN